MKYEDLLLEKKDGIATITLNAPDKLNALSIGMKKSLPLAVDELAKDDDVKVVIVTGAGRGFCSGADVTAMGARMDSDKPAEISRYQRLQLTGAWAADIFPKLSKPVIAAINGAAAGAGLTLAVSCDIRIASETARFGAVFVLRGIVPDGGSTFWLPRVLGTSKALELMWTGELINAAEAERLGIVSRVVPPDKLMKTAQELAAKIAQQPPLTVELTKRIVYRAMGDDIARQLELETWAIQICLQSEDQKEAVRAFLEKRPPQFKGR